jgi:MoxR-like ATPase
VVTTSSQHPLSAVQANIAAIRQELNARFLERGREIDALLVAAIARQHLIYIGDAGEAKSAVTEAFCARITGANYFKSQLFAQTTADELTGPFDIPALADRGTLRRITATYMPEAHVAYLDEVFNAGPALLLGLLMMLNEREFRNDGAIQKIPLEFCVGSSNRMPQATDDRGQNLRALQDRFALWLVVPTLSDAGHHQFMAEEITRRKARSRSEDITGKAGTTISLDDLHTLQQAALEVDIPDDVMGIWYQVREALAQKRYPKPSTRRSGWLLDLICGYTILNGRMVATPDDLTILQHALWQRPEDAKPTAAIVLGIANPLLAKAQEVFDVVLNVAEECIVFHSNPAHDKGPKRTKVIEARQAITSLGKELTGLRDMARGTGRDPGPIESMIAQAREKHRQVTRLESDDSF